jgi:hypothetical protein
MKWLSGWGALLLAAVLAGCGGVGSGGTGIDPGSGGTGSAMTASIGSIQGFGSIIVNGVRYETGSADIRVEDADSLKLGMTVQVTGAVASSGTEGTATTVVSAADLRGTVESLATGSNGFVVLGVRATTDSGTVFDGVAGVYALQPGDTVQVHGLPMPGGELRATRVEKLAASALPVVSGAVEAFDPASATFRIGALTVNYAGASVEGTLAQGLVVRVRGSAPPAAGVLAASSVEPWFLPPADPRVPVEIAGVVSDFAGLASFRVGGVTVDASAAQISGGQAAAIGNGVRLAVTGTLQEGVLRATRVKIQHVPGTGGPAGFSLSGPVANYQSPASFQVRGQRVDASGPGVAFSGGTAADLANGRQVTVSGDQVTSGVLIATAVTFAPAPGTADPSDGTANPGTGTGGGNNGGGTGGGTPDPGTGNSGQAGSVSGPVANYQSLRSFQVQNQAVDAGGPDVTFSGGTSSDLANGRQVTVQGTYLNGVLVAHSVSIAPADNAGGGNGSGGGSGTGGGSGNGSGNGNGNGSGNGSGNGNNGGGNGNGNGA